ncbi:hypothetical protein [Chamaesiphon sp. OTE_8_metabat_110]|uniref:hypothetical protein n=1 Tax=Chamaesiphon sp. OTE_8_metabat_110 TaxID=2964696 RepID=UPI00286D608E|nr:hypothetical protein [Chamaesiphon sp. OTE_8_metabat_110]
MLKIWLTWLQPSLGVLGTALVLSNPLCTYAATKPAPRNISKAATPTAQWSNLKSAGTRIDRELFTGMAVTPDFAVRQLAMSSLGNPTAATKIAPKARPVDSNPVTSFVSPGARYPQFAKTTKQIKPPAKNSAVASALARAINPQSAIPVPGLYIGNSNPRVANKFARTGTPVVPPVASASDIGAPTPLSAMMAAGKSGVDPFPVVRPELMQKLERNIAANNVPTTKTAPYALDPIATIPPAKPQAVTPKTIVSQVKSTPYQSLDPIAAIPSGLQRVLGNNLNTQPIVAANPVATNAKAINPMLALRQIVSPDTDTVATSVNAASLQLATAQAYTSVPKFNIPGETLLTAKQFKPVNDLVLVKRTPQNFTIAAPSSRKTTYATTLAPTTKQPWTVVNQQNNLGGLILGSPQLATAPRVASLLPADTTDIGLPVRGLVEIN